MKRTKILFWVGMLVCLLVTAYGVYGLTQTETLWSSDWWKNTGLVISAVSSSVAILKNYLDMHTTLNKSKSENKGRTYLSGTPKKNLRNTFNRASEELPPGSRLPFLANKQFTGRDEDLNNLYEMLVTCPTFEGPVVISGIGGSGKTQLAVEFCRYFGNNFAGVHWIQAAQPDEIPAEIAACGRSMDIQPWPDAQEDQVEATLHSWEESPNRLVVIDNIETPASIYPLLARLEKNRVLITSRQTDWLTEVGIQVYRLPMLERDKSLELLRKLAQDLQGLPDEKLDPLAETLGDLPLALDLAGRYLAKCEIHDPQIFLRELEKVGGVVRHPSQRGVGTNTPTKHAESLELTFALSWKELDQQDEVDALGARLFCMTGYCTPTASVPNTLLMHAAGLVEDQEPLFRQSLLRLYDLGLLRKTPEGPNMHPLLASFAKVVVPNEKHDRYLMDLANSLTCISEEANITHATQSFLPLRLHMETVALALEVAKLPGAGSLWHNLGRHLELAADYPRALACYQRALVIDEKELGPEHTNVAHHHNNIGLIYYRQGRTEEAKERFERALAIDEKVHGPGDITVSYHVNNIGLIMIDLCRYEEAKVCFQRAIEINEKALGTANTELVFALLNLGSVWSNLGRYAEAREYFERALVMNKKLFGVEHPTTGFLLRSLGVNHRQMGEYPESLALLEQAGAIVEKTLDAEHPEMAQVWNGFGSVFLDQGEYTKAEDMFQRAARIIEKRINRENGQLTNNLYFLGRTKHQMGRLAEAKEHLERALAISLRLFHDNNIHIANAQWALSQVLLDQGEVQKAQDLCQQALHIDQKLFPGGHPSVARDLLGLAAIEARTEHLSESITYCDQALVIDLRFFPETHPKIQHDQEMLASLQRVQGQ